MPLPRRLLSLALLTVPLALTATARADDDDVSRTRASLEQTLQALKDSTAASGLAQLSEATSALAGSEAGASQRVAFPPSGRRGMLLPGPR